MRWLPRSREGRLVLGAAAVLVGFNLVALIVDALVPSPEGPRSSSFATAPDGVAAWAELARDSGRDVRALRARPSDDTLPSEGTVVVLDPEDFSPGQARALRRFAERGGRVVAGAAPETGAARTVTTAGGGHWSSAKGALPLVGGDDGPIVLVMSAGDGRIALVADASPLHNRRLDDADNAALALALAGPGPLTFVESAHGYGTATGLAVLPARFRWALVLLALSALVLIAARWPRLGPPEPLERPLFPPRRAYVDALAATLARSRDRATAVQSVRAAARERLARRAALPRDADAEAWAAAARAAGLTNDEARAIHDEADDDGIAAGRALARLM
jgi:hypothetical protein